MCVVVYPAESKDTSEGEEMKDVTSPLAQDDSHKSEDC